MENHSNKPWIKAKNLVRMPFTVEDKIEQSTGRDRIKM
jgi:hypothetical protein